MRFKPLNGKIGAFLIALFIVGSLYSAMPEVRTATPIPGTGITKTARAPGTCTIHFLKQLTTVNVGSNFQIDIWITDISGDLMASFDFTATWDKTQMELVGYQNHVSDEASWSVGTETATDNTYKLTAYGPGTDGARSWVTITFHCINAGESSLNILYVKIEGDDPVNGPDFEVLRHKGGVIQKRAAPPFDFTLMLLPPSVTVKQGETANYQLQIAYNHPSYYGTQINYQVTGLGPGINWVPSGGGTIPISTSLSAPPGTYPITVIGSAQGKTHQTSATLIVTDSTPSEEETSITLIESSSPTAIEPTTVTITEQIATPTPTTEPPTEKESDLTSQLLDPTVLMVIIIAVLVTVLITTLIRRRK